MKEHKILFPTDFTEQSIRALRETVALNQVLGYGLIVLHAYSRPYAAGYDQEGVLEKKEKQIENQFETLVSDVPGLQAQHYAFRKVLGDTIDSVAELVEKESVHLIVMSTKGAAGIGELFGTKTARIIKSVSVPVIVLPTDSTLMPMSKLALACDYSKETPRDTFDFLNHLAEKVSLEVDLVTLNRDRKTMTEKELRNRENLVSIIDKVAHSSSFIEHDDIKWGLIEYARSKEIGMIGVIPKSYTFIERLFHDSLTQNMAFHSPLPVLVLQ